MSSFFLFIMGDILLSIHKGNLLKIFSKDFFYIYIWKAEQGGGEDCKGKRKKTENLNDRELSLVDLLWKWPWQPYLGQTGARSPGLHQDLPCAGRDSSRWIINCWLGRCVIRKQDWKWSCQHLNWSSTTGFWYLKLQINLLYYSGDGSSVLTVCCW